MFWKSAMPSSSSSSAAAAGRGRTILDHTNLDRFLDSVTPCLPVHFLPRSRIQGINASWLPIGDEPIPYFTLADLWQGFDQASTYGVGSRVLFDDGDVITQYYCPSLSAIQIFTNKPYVSARGEVARCDIGISWSDDNESEKFPRSLSNTSSPTWEAYINGTTENRSSLSSDKSGYTYLNYCEFVPPYWRIPFYEKIMEFTQTLPELLTLSSVELSPLSWMAVVWYPIYSIPSQTRSKDLSTIFLTFYNLSPSSLGDEAVTEGKDKGKAARKNNLEKKKPVEGKKDMICLRPFGLSTFKLSGNIWSKNESDAKKISSLQSAADSWLKQLSFFHQDFSFYLTQQASQQHK